MVAIMVLVFFDGRTALFTLLTTVLISAVMASYQLEFIFMQFVAGIIRSPCWITPIGTDTFWYCSWRRRSDMSRSSTMLGDSMDASRDDSMACWYSSAGSCSLSHS